MKQEQSLAADGAPMGTDGRSLDDRRFDHITGAIIGAAFEVHNELGRGYSEKVYENAMVIVLRSKGFDIKQQVPMKVWFRGQSIGDFVADLLVEDVVLVELKSVDAIHPTFVAKCINYVTTTRSPVGLVINFGDKVTFRRVAGPTLRASSVPIGASSTAGLDSLAEVQ